METKSFLEKPTREPNSELKEIIPSLGNVEKAQIINLFNELKSGKLFDNHI